MIDIKLLRTDPETVKENIKRKFQDDKLVLVDEVLSLDEQCRKATARGPEDRYPSCQDLAADLRRWLRGERPRAHRRGWCS